MATRRPGGQRRKVGEIGFDRGRPGLDPLVGRSTSVGSVALVLPTTLTSLRNPTKKRCEWRGWRRWACARACTNALSVPFCLFQLHKDQRLNIKSRVNLLQ